MKVLIVDDEKPARDRLRRLLGVHPQCEIIGEATNGIDALHQIAEFKPDLVFLDIEMPELSGIEVAQSLAQDGPLVIFVTAYDQYALAAFEASAIDYIVKPVHPTRLKLALGKINKLNRPQLEDSLQQLISGIQPVRCTEKLAVRIGQRFEILNPTQISAVFALDHYAQILVGDREFLSDESLDHLTNRLRHGSFLRVHRKALINVDYLEKLQRLGDCKYKAILNDYRQSEIQISRERLPELKKKLGLLDI